MKKISLGLMIAAVVAVFILQVWHLGLASAPYTDEGDHLYSAWMLSKGMLPYRDFLYLHPPGLPLFGAFVLKLTGSVYALRFLYLGLNCLGAILLFFGIRKVTGSHLGALFGVLFYLTYSDMVHHDWRFLATRQLACTLWVGFFYLTVCAKRSRAVDIALSAIALFGSLLFYPFVLNLGFLCFGLLVSEKDRVLRRELLSRFLPIGIVVGVGLLLFLLLPGTFHQTITEHIQAPDAGFGWRWDTLTNSNSPNQVFFIFSLIGLFLGAVAKSGLRWISVAMLGMIGSIFFPREFFPHYFVIAAPAFVFGIAMWAVMIEKWLPRFRVLLSIALLSAVLFWHESRVFSGLWDEWRNNVDPAYRSDIAFLATLPEPILTFMNPVYAVEAKREITPHFHRATMRFFRLGAKKPDWKEIDELANRSCTLFLTPEDQEFLPESLIQDWRTRFEMVDEGTIWILNNPRCERIN